jgi:GTPase Era involved in 16S rRNA processing
MESKKDKKIVFMGPTNSGKSTFISSLLDIALPTSNEPMTLHPISIAFKDGISDPILVLSSHFFKALVSAEEKFVQILKNTSDSDICRLADYSIVGFQSYYFNLVDSSNQVIPQIRDQCVDSNTNIKMTLTNISQLIFGLYMLGSHFENENHPIRVACRVIFDQLCSEMEKLDSNSCLVAMNNKMLDGRFITECPADYLWRIKTEKPNYIQIITDRIVAEADTIVYLCPKRDLYRLDKKFVQSVKDKKKDILVILSQCDQDYHKLDDDRFDEISAKLYTNGKNLREFLTIPCSCRDHHQDDAHKAMMVKELNQNSRFAPSIRSLFGASIYTSDESIKQRIKAISNVREFLLECAAELLAKSRMETLLEKIKL